MDLRSGLPYFLIRNGLAYDYPELHMDLRCEVLIVGVGITGALCAQACAVVGLHTVVVDGRSIGTGSTSASTALLQYEIDTPMHILAEKVGLEGAVRAYRLGVEAVEGILHLARHLDTCDAVARESLQFASKRGHVEALRKEHDLRSQHGFQVDLLERKEIEARFGFSKPAALLSHTAAEIDPYAFTHALLKEVLANGGEVYDRTVVEKHERVGTGFRVRTVQGHTIRAQHLIMATGYESQGHLPKNVIDLSSTYAVASQRMERDSFWYHDCFIWETAQPYHYLRTTPDRRIIIGGEDEPFRDPKRRDALLDRKARRLVQAFHKLFPDIPFVADLQWCGTFGSTKDGLPYIDRDERSGAWFVLGMGGNGITFSRIGAVIVRDVILGKPNRDTTLFRFGR